MAAAAVGTNGCRTGMVAMASTAGDLLNLNPHVHAISPRGGWDPDGEWVPIPFVDRDTAERLFRAKVLAMLTGEGLLSDERARVLMSWRHSSDFSVDDSVRFEPEDRTSMETVARSLLRPPLSLGRMATSKGDDEVVYRRKGKDGRPGEEERVDGLEFLARVIAHIPPPREVCAGIRRHLPQRVRAEVPGAVVAAACPSLRLRAGRRSFFPLRMTSPDGRLA